MVCKLDLLIFNLFKTVFVLGNNILKVFFGCCKNKAVTFINTSIMYGYWWRWCFIIISMTPKVIIYWISGRKCITAENAIYIWFNSWLDDFRNASKSFLFYLSLISLSASALFLPPLLFMWFFLWSYNVEKLGDNCINYYINIWRGRKKLLFSDILGCCLFYLIINTHLTGMFLCSLFLGRNQRWWLWSSCWVCSWKCPSNHNQRSLGPKVGRS